MDKTYAEVLDEILNAVNNLESLENDGKKIINSYQEILADLKTKYNFKIRDKDLIFKKLIDDGRIIFDEYWQIHRTTFEGKDFLKEYNGTGYATERQNKINQHMEERLRIDRAEKNADRLTYGTWILCGITLLLVAAEVIKEWEKFVRFFCGC